MSDLIDRDVLIDWIDVGHLRHPTELCFSEIDVVNMVMHMPTVDAVPLDGSFLKLSKDGYVIYQRKWLYEHLEQEVDILKSAKEKQ